MTTTTKRAPAPLVDSFLEEQNTDAAGNRLLHYFQNYFWSWRVSHYIKRDDSTIYRDFLFWLEQNYHIPGRSEWSTLKEVLEFRVMLAEEQAMPAWICQTKTNTNVIAFENGLLDLHHNRMQEHSPVWFSANCLPYKYDPEAKCPQWCQFLDEIFEGDQERIALLQEWFGYCLTPDISQQKAMLLYGVPRSGKSTIARIQTRLLGTDNVSGVRLELFGERFQLISTVGKLVNIADETDQAKHFHEGIFKAFVAGERLTVEDKGRTPKLVDTTARLLIIANDQIPFRDVSGAVSARLLILPFDKSFLGKEDKGLEERLAGELAGIFNWSLAGKERLKAQGTFTVTAIGQEEKADLIQANNHILQWAGELTWGEDLLEVREDSPSSSEVYAHYFKWCKARGNKPMAEQRLARVVRVAQGYPRQWKPKVVKRFGSSTRVWPGLSLPDGWEE